MTITFNGEVRFPKRIGSIEAGRTMGCVLGDSEEDRAHAIVTSSNEDERTYRVNVAGLTDPQAFYQELSRRGYKLVSSRLTREAETQ